MAKDEALRLALEALELALRCHGVMLLSDPPKDAWKYHGVEANTNKAITAIKAALEAKDEPEQMAKLGWQVIDCPICGGGARAFSKQEAKDEPVAWLHRFIEGGISIGLKPLDLERHPERWEPLYTTPPQRTWVGLTDDEITQEVGDSQGLRDIIRNIEHKLKEKNT
jgi:hypothetical protein